MKISAVGANRSVYQHTVMDAPVKSISVKDDVIVFNALSEQDPGIGTGQFLLTINLDKQEAFGLFEAAISMDMNLKIKKLESEIEDLKDQLRDV